MSLSISYTARDVRELERLRTLAASATDAAGLISIFDSLWLREGQSLDLSAPPGTRDIETMMENFDGLEMHWSYLCASVLGRALNELGLDETETAFRSRRILWESPETIVSVSADLEWLEEAPRDWRPLVREDSQRVLVSFHTWDTGEGGRLITHEDWYRRDGFDYRPSERVIARV